MFEQKAKAIIIRIAIPLLLVISSFACGCANTGPRISKEELKELEEDRASGTMSADWDAEIKKILASSETLMDLLDNVWEALKAMRDQIAFAFGSVIANAIQSAITGSGGFRKAIGDMIIAVGNLVIA